MEYIFITGMPRSGTTFTGNLLLNGIENTTTFHEYIGNREFAILSYYMGEKYTETFLKKEKQKIESKFKSHLFIDVNGELRNSVPGLRKIFKPKNIYHLIRNPKNVVRSIYTRRSEKRVHWLPRDNEGIKWWLDADKFSRICWNWADTTQALLQQQTNLIKFEKIITDYNYLDKKILKPNNITISQSIWETRVNKKVNRTRGNLYRYIYSRLKGKEMVKDRLPDYEKWSNDYKDKFHEICGPLMKKIGYKN